MTFDFTKPSNFIYTHTLKSGKQDSNPIDCDWLGTPIPDQPIWYDPLLVACYCFDSGSHGLSLTNSKQIPSVEGLLAQPHILELREKVDTYFSAKITTRLFKNGGVSRFRQDMLHILCGTTTILDSRDIGLIARMPEYYQYDIKFEEEIVPGLEGWDETTEVTKNHSELIERLQVKYKLFRNVKAGIDQPTSKKIEYYCQGSFQDRKFPVMIDVSKHELIGSVLEFCLNQNKTIQFNPEEIKGKMTFVDNKPIFKASNFTTLTIKDIS